MDTIAELKKTSGSCYHRLVTPLQSFAHFSENLKTTLVSNYKSLWINRNTDISAGTLAIWKEMFDLLIVFDLDDSLKIPKDYLKSKKLNSQKDTVISKMLAADVVVVSTVELQQELLEYGIESVYIPNRLPYGKGQFTRKEESWEEFKDRKIQVGIIGSYFHTVDWKPIKGWINTLIHKQEFKQNCEFNVCGWHETTNELWADFLKLGKVHKGLPVDQYIQLYQELDIILCPLQDNWFNRCKSSLKILEAACGNAVCVLDELYSEKSDIPDVGHPVVQKEQDWLNIPLQLISDKEKLWELKQSTANKCFELEFEPVVIQRQELNKTIPTKQSVEDQIYTIVYRPEQPSEYIRYENKINTVQDKSYLFEYNVILDIEPQPDKWVGVFSWKFPLKTHLPKNQVIRILNSHKEYDVINFCRPLSEPYLQFTEKQHKGFLELFRPLCKDLGLKVKEPQNVIYSNFFVMKGDLFKEYQDFLKQAIFLLETRYSYLAWRDANYSAGLPKAQLKQYTGLDYYPFHTFILERLISLWIDHKKLRCYNHK